MRLGALHNRDDGRLLVRRVWRATNMFERARGLLGRPRLDLDEGLLIPRCRSVHTFGMTYSLDLVFIDTSGVIRKLVNQLGPRRVAGCAAGRMVIELAAGSIGHHGLEPGMQVSWTRADP